MLIPVPLQLTNAACTSRITYTHAQHTHREKVVTAEKAGLFKHCVNFGTRDQRMICSDHRVTLYLCSDPRSAYNDSCYCTSLGTLAGPGLKTAMSLAISFNEVRWTSTMRTMQRLVVQATASVTCLVTCSSVAQFGGKTAKWRTRSRRLLRRLGRHLRSEGKGGLLVSLGEGLSSFSLNRFLFLGQGLVDPRHPMSDFGRLDG